jgi:hypothetical protein
MRNRQTAPVGKLAESGKLCGLIFAIAAGATAGWYSSVRYRLVAGLVQSVRRRLRPWLGQCGSSALPRVVHSSHTAVAANSQRVQ